MKIFYFIFLFLFSVVVLAADVKISALPAATTPLGGTEVVPCVQAGTTDKCTVASIGSSAGAGTLTATQFHSIAAFSVFNNNTNATAVPIVTANPIINELGAGGTPGCNTLATSGGCVANQPGVITLYNSGGTLGTFITESDAVGTSVNGGAMAIISGDGSLPNGTGGSNSRHAGQGHGTGGGGSIGLVAGAALGSGLGGSVNIGSGSSNTGNAGSITMNGGNGATFGGDITVTAGSGQSARGGVITFLGGGSTASTGGEIIFTAGNGSEISGTALGGNISFTPGQGATSTSVDAGFISFFDFGSTEILRLDGFDNGVFSLAASTDPTITDGFVYIGSSAGLPTGVPAHLTGFYVNEIPIRYDTTNNQFCAYNSGWKCVRTELTATSASIGGGLLAVGACASTATTVTGAAVGMAVIATPNTYPGDSSFWKSYVSGANTVTTLICESVASTPVASTYNIRVIQ
jgi:hypothetical protein